MFLVSLRRNTLYEDYRPIGRLIICMNALLLNRYNCSQPLYIVLAPTSYHENGSQPVYFFQERFTSIEL